ncbi:DUF1592 domain-containing protein [Stratiformator vulcanicus]|uniref:Planctomycete cytochrome C n=1 Tax=Stratiformator vulcanicus TaxID=2527980 RepID=A0A517QYS3_9PLAN|nr:DUF1592 domain-containing protein [Stratiformator vulcanicus]QDT36795.1 Planctomycete cytochrome C [Stratiformator vulcanicus]
MRLPFFRPIICLALLMVLVATPAIADSSSNKSASLFDADVARILANRCLQCHDSASAKGGVDLSRRAAAIESGALVPGKPADSQVWESVVNGEMPKGSDPIPKHEADAIKRWIDDGAAYTVDWIDPVVYGRGSDSSRRWVRRLTRAEYVATVKATLGVDLTDEAKELLPPDLRADGFSNTAYNLGVDMQHIDGYAKLAEIAVERTDISKFARRFEKKRLMIDKVMRPLIGKMGRVLLRGPLDEWEVDQYRGLTTTVASAGGNFDDAVAITIEAMLQSPRFLYRMERQHEKDGRAKLNDYEVASRLSYFIWGGPPDEQLLDAAEKGNLSNRKSIETEVRRMLKDPRATEQTRQFISEWINLSRLGNLQPDRDHYPDWNDELASDMRTETLRFAEEVLWADDRPLSDLFDAQFTYLTPTLAKHYGIKPTGEGLRRYDLEDVPSRGGLFTQGSVLTIGGDEASMVARGLFVLHDVLRGAVKDPPPCVDTTPVPTEPGRSNRSIAEARIKNEACGGCHKRFEPLAFGLEQFDGLGRHASRDRHGNTLREDGTVLFPGDAKATPFESTAELSQLLSESDRVRETLTWKFIQFALGRMPTGTEAPLVRDVHQRAWQSGGTYQDLVVALATSDLILTAQSETEE